MRGDSLVRFDGGLSGKTQPFLAGQNLTFYPMSEGCLRGAGGWQNRGDRDMPGGGTCRLRVVPRKAGGRGGGLANPARGGRALGARPTRLAWGAADLVTGGPGRCRASAGG